MALKDMAIPQIRQVHMYESYGLYSYLASTLERQKQHIAIADLQATFVHDAAHCNRIFYRIFLRVIICKFSLRILMKYTDNIAELLAHARTVDTRLSSPIFVKLMRLLQLLLLECARLLSRTRSTKYSK